MRGYIPALFITGVATPVIYFVSFGLGVGVTLDETRSEQYFPDGYAAFIAPALMTMLAIAIAFEELTYPVLLGLTSNSTYVAAHTTPVTPRQITAGVILATTLRQLVTALVFFAVLVAVLGLPLSGVWPLIPLSLSAGFSVALPVMAYVITLKTDQNQIALISRFIVAPIVLLSASFFPADFIPASIRWALWLSPIWHTNALSRSLISGVAVEPLIGAAHVLYPAVLAVGGLIVTTQLLKRRLEE